MLELRIACFLPIPAAQLVYFCPAGAAQVSNAQPYKFGSKSFLEQEEMTIPEKNSIFCEEKHNKTNSIDFINHNMQTNCHSQSLLTILSNLCIFWHVFLYVFALSPLVSSSLKNVEKFGGKFAANS